MFILIMHMFIRAGHNVLTGKSNEKMQFLSKPRCSTGLFQFLLLSNSKIFNFKRGNILL